MSVRRHLVPWTAFAVLIGASWWTASQVELFENVYDFSRAHERWELDEIFSFLMLLGLTIPLFLAHWNHRLRQNLRARRDAEARAQHISRHDALTGLHNRRVLNEEMTRRIALAADGGPGLAVILLDLDRFKPINDLRGHAAGDLILQEVGGRIRTSCLEGQVPVRLGGDEFAVVVEENDEMEAATGLARRILATLEEKFQIGEGTVSVGASVGIAIWNEGIDSSELLRQADQAMYRAKRDGRGRFAFFDNALGERLREAAELEVELNVAIERKDIVPYFQPIVDIASRRLVGFEALARWKHERLGQIPPTRFIRLAEDTGRINAISWLMLRQACETAKDWAPELTISVNLSPKQFQDKDLAATVASVLGETGFPPERLEVEITETAVIEDLEHARRTIDELRWLGIQISLDDFGTGFSSLATLSRLPFDRLKIDRSFISEVTRDGQKAKIVAGIISLAESLDLSVTAEGIETEDTCSLLADLNCGLGQGYLFERPIPGEDVRRLLETEWGDLTVQPESVTENRPPKIEASSGRT